MTELSSAILKLKDWFTVAALPLWAAKGYDVARGGFYEALNFDASPSTGRPRRVRSQARQIHTFSHAALKGWLPEGEALAAQGFDYFLKHACPDGGDRGCVHLISDSGETLVDRRDLYDQAFLLLACASRIAATDDARAFDLATKTVAFIDDELASPFGGWLESDRKELPRRQNPHMHLFEAFMALYRATNDKRFFDQGAKIIDQCFPAFFDLENGVIIEQFHENMTFDRDSIVVEPGHMFEWIWLLRQWERISGADYSTVRKTLLERGVHFGRDPAWFGFVSNTIDIKAPQRHSSKRLWPQTEYLRALLADAADEDGDRQADATALIDNLFDTYLAAEVKGLWIDEFDVNGAPVAQDVPASILYHLFEAVAEADNFLNMECKT